MPQNDPTPPSKPMLRRILGCYLPIHLVICLLMPPSCYLFPISKKMKGDDTDPLTAFLAFLLVPPLAIGVHRSSILMKEHQ